ncbi:AMP-binding protein [Roseovarius pacificus]|uniref:class I adenylate-forming enzyme family protein n=1 Tax=Roseovarius pacificus TaxID=337701 RepID=UPI002A18A955|nr:AMP-binding protein [Roseovarius pacificus]
MNFTDVVTPVLQHATLRPNHPAFVFEDETITYGELADSSRRTATALLTAGVRKGERVAVLTPNRPEIFSIYLGLAMIGATIVPVNPEYAAHEIRYILGHSDARMIVCAAEQTEKLTIATDGLQIAPMIRDFEDLLIEAGDADPYTGPQIGILQDLVLLCYTSGTTSLPKGVAANHRNELASALAYSGMMAISPHDRVLVTLPITFSYGFHAASYVAMLSGATVLLEPRFHPRLALEAIETLRPTVFLGVPTMYAMMADVAAKSERRYDISSLRLAAASGAALNEQIVADCEKHLGLIVRPYYAMTEVRPIFSFDLRQSSEPPKGSVGKLIAPTEARLVDENGDEVNEGQVGELFVRGPSFSGAYYNDPERTALAMKNGWFRTGDLVSRDDSGNYFIVGRTSDQIISGGANISPLEVEDALLCHPGIASAAVVGCPDPVFGQIVKAVIVKADPALQEEEVIAHCQRHIADYKVPRQIEFMDVLPTAPSGKVLKSELV